MAPITKPTPDPKPEHPIADRPGRPGGHPDHELPDPPHPEPHDKSHEKSHEKSARASSRAAEPTSVLTGLLPSSAAVGDPSFMLRVVGTLFDPTSVIVFAGQDEETVFVSTEELTTGVNMPLWQGPDPAIPVLVRTGGVETDPLLFAMTPPREVPLDPAHASKPIPLMDQV
jgi:hypothetical protein